MAESPSLLHSYLRTVTQLHQIESVTLFLPQERQRPLVHVGEGLAPPELSTVLLAEDFASQEPGNALIAASRDASCRLVRLGAPGPGEVERRRGATATEREVVLGLRLGEVAGLGDAQNQPRSI